MVIPLKDDNPVRTKPVLTVSIIAACIYVFAFIQPQAGSGRENAFLVQNAAIPCEVTHEDQISNELSAQCDGEITIEGAAPDQELFPDKNVYLSILISMFLHGSWLHLLGNMLFLWIFGNNIEDRFGKVGFAAFYVLCGIAAAAAHIFTQPNSTHPVVGASGAIAGVMGAYLVLFPRARILTLVPLFIFIQFVYLPAFIVLLLWFGMQFLTNPNTGVAVAAHVGGFAAGVVLTVLVMPLMDRPPRRQPDVRLGP